MKPNHLLAVFLISCYIVSITSLNKSSKKANKKKKPQTYFEGYFFLQRLYPGIVALDNLKYSSSKSKLKYFTLNEKFIYFSKNAKDKTKIQGGIKLKRLLDKRSDITKEGKCCSNVKYFDFSPKSDLKSQKTPLYTKTGKENGNKMSFKKANYCLEIFAPFRARWRICSLRPIDAYRLQLKIVFTLIKTTVDMKKVKSPVVIEKFLTHSKLAPDVVEANWNWETQKKWSGKCQSKFMQSPIKIEEDQVSTTQSPSFKIKYNLLNTHIEIVRRFNEIVVQFKNDPGLMMIEYGTRRILYKPKYISFRFPGEHNILGKRYTGDMLINCEEVAKDKNKRTNGLVFTIPMEAKNEYSNYKELDGLSVDFWKYIIKKKGSYSPKDFLTKKKLVFKLKDMMKAVVGMKPLYYFYLGSQTVPPCYEYVYHLILGKPIKIASCQFKVLRENSLASNEARQIHSRLTQMNDPDDYDDGGSDEGDHNDGSDGGSSSGNGANGKGKGKRRSRGGVMAIHGISYDPDLDHYIDDEDLRKRMLRKRLDGGKDGLDNEDLDLDDALNC